MIKVDIGTKENIVETKFKTGDTIYFMQRNKIVSKPIIGVLHISIEMGYEQSFIQNSPGWFDNDLFEKSYYHNQNDITVYITDTGSIEESFAFESFESVVEYLKHHQEIKND